MFTFNRFFMWTLRLSVFVSNFHAKTLSRRTKNCFKTYFDIAPSIDNN